MMEHTKEHPDHERARNAGRVSPDHGDTPEKMAGEETARRHGPTPGHPTVILDPSDITSAQIGPGGLGDLVSPEETQAHREEEERKKEEAGTRRQ